MNKIYINELEKYIDSEITIQGFIDNIRNLQYVIFIILKDSTGKVQITIEKENNDELVKSIESLTLESTVKITGKLEKNEKVKLNGMEIIPNKIKIPSLILPFHFEF